MGSDLKYGPKACDAERNAIPMPVTAGETFRAKSGRFVTLTTNTGCVEVADAGDTVLFGYAEAPDGVTVSGQVVNVIPALGSTEIFRIPVITGTLTQAMIGSTCDIVRATVGGVTLVQGADLTASGEDVVTIVGGAVGVVGGTDGAYVDVMFTPVKLTSTQGVV